MAELSDYSSHKDELKTREDIPKFESSTSGVSPDNTLGSDSFPELQPILGYFSRYVKYAMTLSIITAVFGLVMFAFSGFGLIYIDPAPLSVLIGTSGASFTVHIFGFVKEFIKKRQKDV